jgi:hypothetical protein
MKLTQPAPFRQEPFIIATGQEFSLVESTRSFQSGLERVLVIMLSDLSGLGQRPFEISNIN